MMGGRNAIWEISDPVKKYISKIEDLQHTSCGVMNLCGDEAVPVLAASWESCVFFDSYAGDCDNSSFYRHVMT